VEQLAADVFGRPMKLRMVSDEAGQEQAAPTQKSLISEDPVLQGFARHLGGEVVVPKSKKRSEGS
jgi:hypothetical protein